jgi:hypothetical protein
VFSYVRFGSEFRLHPFVPHNSLFNEMPHFSYADEIAGLAQDHLRISLAGFDLKLTWVGQAV